MTSTSRDKVPKNSPRDIFVCSTTDSLNNYSNVSKDSPSTGIVTQISPDTNSNYSLDAKYSLHSHNNYLDQNNHHIQHRESSSIQSGSDSGLGYTNSISSENSSIVNGGTRTDQTSDSNNIDPNIYINSGHSKNPHQHPHNNRESSDTTAVIDNNGDNITAYKAASSTVISPVSGNFVADHNNNKETSSKDTNKNLAASLRIAASKNGIADKSLRQPSNASSSSPSSCTKVKLGVKNPAHVSESRISVVNEKSRNDLSTLAKHPVVHLPSGTPTSASSIENTIDDVELDKINGKCLITYDSHPGAPNHSDIEALAASSQDTLSNNVPILRSALRKTFNNSEKAQIKTKRSCRNVSFNQTVIVFCEEIEASSPSEQFDPPINYRDSPNCGNDAYEIVGNYDDEDYVEAHQGQSNVGIRDDLEILSKIVGEDASKLSDDQLFGLLENGSLLNNIDLSAGNLSDDDEFTKNRLNSNQSYLCHDAISDTDSESSLIIEECRKGPDAISKTNQKSSSSSQVSNSKKNEKHHASMDEDKIIHSNYIDCKISNCERKDSSLNCQVSQPNDGPNESQGKQATLLQAKSMPARMKVSPVDNQARRQQNAQHNRNNENHDSSEYKTENKTICSISDTTSMLKVLNNSTQVESALKFNPVMIKQSNIEPVIFSRPILRSNVVESNIQQQQIVSNQDCKSNVDNTFIPNSSAIIRPNNQTTVQNTSSAQSMSREINAPQHKFQQPSIVDIKNKILTPHGNPTCHICRAIESDRNPVNSSINVGKFADSIQNDVLPCIGSSQNNYQQRSLHQINHIHGTGLTGIEQSIKSLQSVSNSQSCVSCRELSLRQQQQQQLTHNYTPQICPRPVPMNFGQQPRPIACQFVYVIDQNGNRVKALQVVNPAQQNALNSITGHSTHKIFIAPDLNRLPTPGSVSRQHFVHSPDVTNLNPNSYVAQNIPAKNAQNYINSNAQPNEQNTLVNRVMAVNNQTSSCNQRTQIINHTGPKNHTIYYVRQPLGAQNIRQSFELSPSSTVKSFPDAHEIRRLDGIRAPTASPNLVNRQQPGDSASTLQQALLPQHKTIPMQHESMVTKRISEQRGDDGDDPSFGFSRRPAVKVVSTVANQTMKPSESTPKSIETEPSSYSLNCVLTNRIVHKNGGTDQRPCLMEGSQTLDRKNMNCGQNCHQAVKENIPNASSMSNISRTLSSLPDKIVATGSRTQYKSKVDGERLMVDRQPMEHLVGRSNSHVQDNKDQIRPEVAYVMNI